jgi:beta-lactam-binding protein with PASTA domain
MVKENRQIQLTISLPPAKLEMPDLVAITERQATIALDRLGLILTNVFTDSSDLFEKTVVMDQSVYAGLPVAPGDSIELTVSLGKRNLKKTMPDILNKSLDEAIRTLQKAGFSVGDIKYTESSELLYNTVVRQSIDSGKIFPRERDISVDLLVTDGF